MPGGFRSGWGGFDISQEAYLEGAFIIATGLLHFPGDFLICRGACIFVDRLLYLLRVFHFYWGLPHLKHFLWVIQIREEVASFLLANNKSTSIGIIVDHSTNLIRLIEKIFKFSWNQVIWNRVDIFLAV